MRISQKEQRRRIQWAEYNLAAAKEAMNAINRRYSNEMNIALQKLEDAKKVLDSLRKAFPATSNPEHKDEQERT